jgi:hypothetical protein
VLRQEEPQEKKHTGTSTTTGSVDLLQEWVLGESHGEHRGANRRPHFDSGVGVRGTPERLGAGKDRTYKEEVRLLLIPEDATSEWLCAMIDTRRPVAIKRRSAMVGHRDNTKLRIERVTAGVNLNWRRLFGEEEDYKKIP